MRCHNCESGRGFPRGIATTNPGLAEMLSISWASNRINNLYQAWSWQLKEILRRLGLRGSNELVGRTDFLVHLDYYDWPVEDDLRRGV